MIKVKYVENLKDERGKTKWKRKELKKKLEEDIRMIISSVKLLGIPIKELNSYKGGNTYIISKSDIEYIWVIPSDVEQIVGSNQCFSQ